MIKGQFTWQIGTDSREFNGNELNLSFNEWRQDPANWNPNDPNISKPIAISLTVRYDKEECIEDKDTLKQHTRNLVFVKGNYVGIPFGKFKGKTIEDDQERIVEIAGEILDSVPFSSQSRVYFINFPNLEDSDTLICVGSSPFEPKKLQSYRYYWWDSGHDDYLSEWSFNNKALNDGLNMGKITKHHQPPNDLYIEFEYKHVTKDGRVKTYHFKGNKIE